MLDNLGLKLEGVSFEDFLRMCINMGIEPPLESEKMVCMWHNVRVTYYPNVRQLVLKNSLHKLYNSISTGYEGNDTDFSLSNMNGITDCMSLLIFNRAQEDFIVTGNCEFGMNINTGGINPMEIIERWESCDNPFYYMEPRRGKPIQKNCCYSDYKLKIYDKGRQMQRSGINLLRYEITVWQLRKLRNILGHQGDITLKELNEHECWVKLFRYLLKKYDEVKKRPFFTENISMEELYKIHSYCNYALSEDIKRMMNVNTYNKQRAQFKKSYDLYSMMEGNIHLQIREKLQTKFLDLCN